MEKNPFVMGIGFGACLMVYRFKLTYSHILATKQFKTQGRDTNYGSITLLVVF